MSNANQQESIDEEIKKEKIIQDIKTKITEVNKLFKEAALERMDVNIEIKDARAVNYWQYPYISGSISETTVRDVI